MSSRTLYILYESATGYAVFQQLRAEEIGITDIALQQSYQDLSTFRTVVKLVSFAPFRTAEEALENCNCVAEGLMTDYLQQFLSQLFARKLKKGSAFELGVSATTLGAVIHDTLQIPVVSTEHVLELSRCIRLHAGKLLPSHQPGDIERAQCGLTHAYSRNKVKFNVHRVDNMVIQAIALIDHMDKGINQLAMRVKEWYGWHFPELARALPDILPYAKVALTLGDLDQIPDVGKDQELDEKLREILQFYGLDEGLAQTILERARTSMGTQVSELDMLNIMAYARKVADLAEYRTRLTGYLTQKLKVIAPNLTTLLDERIAARLISRTGSLTSLAKAPASTIQILGAEKALFRALKKKGKTPKYGLIFNSSFISRASKPNKGRISRFLANKCAIAARLDCFMEKPTSIFGDVLRNQLEGRLGFLEDKSTSPISNREAMKEAIERYKKLVEKRARKAKEKAALKEQMAS